MNHKLLKIISELNNTFLN